MRGLSMLIAGALLSVSTAAWDCGCAYGEMLPSAHANKAPEACHAERDTAPAQDGEDCCPGCRVEVSDLSVSNLQLAMVTNGQFGSLPMPFGAESYSLVAQDGLSGSRGSWGLPRSDILVRKVPLYISERSLLC